MEIKEYERIDKLYGEYKIIQDTRGFLYGTDAVLLSDFIKINKNEKLLDLCSGSGIIPILIALKNETAPITGLEYFEDLTDMAGRSAQLNGIADRLEFQTGDLKNIKEIFPPESFEAVSVNPPYKTVGSGLENGNYFKKAARHEILCTLDDCVKAAAYALKYGGRFYMVHRADRLPDVIYTLKKYKIEPKTLTLVFPEIDSCAKLLLVEGKKGGGAELKISPPIIMKNRMMSESQ